MAKSKAIISRTQIENLYKVNRLFDYTLRYHEDLLKTHGIDATAIAGYNELSGENRFIFDGFILNVFNACGLESRATLIPIGVYWVEERQYIVKENPSDDFFVGAGSLVRKISKDGSRTVLHKWIHKDYKKLDVILDDKNRYYLRFEYMHHGRKEWLHVTNEKTWY
jgi:hypothetical protein